MDNLENQLLQLWKKANALCGEPESQQKRKDAAMDVDLTQGTASPTHKKNKEDTKPLKIKS
jgi:hypothetical protein